MAYDAMRGMLQTVLMKRALLEMYVAACKAQQADRKNLASNIQFQQIMQDTAHAYAVVNSLSANIRAWRTHHADQLVLPPASGVSLAQMEAFIARIAEAVDDDVDMLIDFPGQGKAGECAWVTPGGRAGIDAQYGEHDLPTALGIGDEADDIEGSADVLGVDDDDDDYHFDADRVSFVTPADANDCYVSWQLAATHHRHHEHDDYACQDMTWPPHDVAGPHMTDAEYRHLFGLTAILEGPYDIFGNSIAPGRDGYNAYGFQLPDDDDSPDYNIPGQ